MSRAVIGLDGLAVEDIDQYDVPGEWHPLPIETHAQTLLSWNGIFSGHDLSEEKGIQAFRKLPDHHPADFELAGADTEFYTYEEVKTDDHVWEMGDVDVVSAPVTVHMYSNIEDPPDRSVTWCTSGEEFDNSIDTLVEKTLGREKVITVFPLPDKMNHMADNGDKPYTHSEREQHMYRLFDAIRTFEQEFDQLIVLSDHGLPSPRRWITDELWVASHDPVGVVRGMGVDVRFENNLTISDTIKNFMGVR